MSQHYVNTELNGEDIVVQIGWDRPLSGFFMNVIQPFNPPEDFDWEGDLSDCEDKYIYSNLEDSQLKFGFSNDTRYFKEKLAHLKIDMPNQIFEIVKKDREYNVGNSVKSYNIVDGSLCSI